MWQKAVHKAPIWGMAKGIPRQIICQGALNIGYLTFCETVNISSPRKHNIVLGYNQLHDSVLVI